MNICFVGFENLPVLAPEYNNHGIGGEQVQQTLMARALVKRGHQVSMVVGDYGQADGASWFGVKTFRSYRSDAGIPVLRFIHPRWTGLWSALSRADADIYYASCAGMHVGLIALFCKLNKRKFVFKIASDTDCEPDKLLITYTRDKKLYEFGLRRCDAIIAQSEFQQKLLKENYGIQSSVAGMIVERSDRFVDFMDRQCDVLWVNNFRQLKRPDVFLKLAQEHPDLKFHMIGGPIPGHVEFYEDIKRQAEQIPNLKFHGRVAYHDMDQWYSGARVFVNTSDIEGFPNSYLQSWVRGTPVVAYFDPDSIIARKQLGVSAASFEELSSAVRALATDDVNWAGASKRCIAYMDDVFGEDLVLAPYLSTFEKLT